MGFEEKIKRLEEINAALKSSDTGLEKAVELYEEGVKLRKTLEESLKAIERRVEIVTSQEGEEPAAKEFDAF